MSHGGRRRNMSANRSQSKIRSGDEIRAEFRRNQRKLRRAECKIIHAALGTIPQPFNGCEILHEHAYRGRLIILTAWKNGKQLNDRNFNIDRGVFTSDLADNPESFFEIHKESLEWLTIDAPATETP
jgi:hypothetical protein